MRIKHSVATVLTIIVTECCVAQTNQIPDLPCDPVIVANRAYKQQTLRASLNEATYALGLPICVEWAKEDQAMLERQVTVPRINLIKVSEVFQMCQDAGFRCKRLSNAIFVSSPSLKDYKDNPLDATARSFAFHGSHKELLFSIMEQFKTGFNWGESNGTPPMGPYSIEIDREITLRDMLMEVANKYGIVWSAIIERERPVLKLKQSDGTEKKVAGSNMEMGFFAVTLSNRPVNVETNKVNDYIRALRGHDLVLRREALNQLLWIDDPAVIASLVSAAKRDDYFAHHIVRALRKFLPKEPRVKDMITEIGAHGDVNALQAALDFFRENNLPVPRGLIEAGLSASEIEKPYVTLQYLLEHGDASHLVLVEPLTNHKNADVSKLAADFVRKTSQQR